MGKLVALNQPDDLGRLREKLRTIVRERDACARKLARLDREISQTARGFADANGDKAKPTLDQLRRALFPGGI